MIVKVGSIVPLSAQIECPGGETYFVRAFIYDKDNNLLTTRDLADKGEGRFEAFSYNMPNLELVIVQYVAYLDSLYTTESDLCRQTEVFTKLEDSGVSGGGSLPVKLFGVIQKKTIKGVLKVNPALVGTISQKQLVGTIKKPYYLKGIINKKTLKGVISCKR